MNNIVSMNNILSEVSALLELSDIFKTIWIANEEDGPWVYVEECSYEAVKSTLEKIKHRMIGEVRIKRSDSSYTFYLSFSEDTDYLLYLVSK